MKDALNTRVMRHEELQDSTVQIGVRDEPVEVIALATVARALADEIAGAFFLDLSPGEEKPPMLGTKLRFLRFACFSSSCHWSHVLSQSSFSCSGKGSATGTPTMISL